MGLGPVHGTIHHHIQLKFSTNSILADKIYIFAVPVCTKWYHSFGALVKKTCRLKTAFMSLVISVNINKISQILSN